MLLHRRQYAEIALHPARIVVVDITFDHADQFLLACEALVVIPLALQDAPEALHRPVVDAMCHAGHTLRHAGLFEFVVECAIRVLEAPVTVEQRMRVGVGLDRFVEGLEHQWIVVALADDVGNNAPVIQVEDGAEIEFMYLNAFIPFELRDIGEPLFVGFVRIELAVEYILCDILRVLCLPGTAVVAVLDGGFYALGTADTQDALIIDMNAVVVAQLVVDAAITLIRTLHVDLLHLFSELFILGFSAAQLAGRPLVICRSGNVQQFTGFVDGITFLGMALLYRTIQMALPYL